VTNAMPAAKSEPEWAAFVAIDWADQKHYWKLVPAGSQQQEQGELQNTPEAVETWAAGLQQRFCGPPHRRLFGAGTRSFGLYAGQVLAPGAVSGAPNYRSGE
jgi:hypothetical protein